MDKLNYRVVSVLAFELKVEGDNVFMVELVNDQGVKAYAILRDSIGDIFNITIGDVGSWYTSPSCRVCEDIQTAVNDYCDKADIRADVVWPKISALVYRSGPSGLTVAEQSCLNSVIDCYNQFIKLEIQHESDTGDVMSAVHKIQDILAMRIVRRAYPDAWHNAVDHRAARQSIDQDPIRQSLADECKDPIQLYVMLGYSDRCRWSSDAPLDCMQRGTPCNVCLEAKDAATARLDYGLLGAQLPTALKKVLGKG